MGSMLLEDYFSDDSVSSDAVASLLAAFDRRGLSVVPAKPFVPCQYCGHWAALYTECGHCGAPVVKK